MWNKEKYKNYINELFLQKDENFAEFSKRIVNSKYELVGLRTPIVQKEAKKLSKEYNEFLNVAEFNTYEEILLYGLVVANIKDYDEYLKYIKLYIPKIDSWALVDSFIAKSKVIEKSLEKNFKFIEKLTKSKKEFESRVGYIMLLDYYISEEYLDKIFKIMDSNTNTTYYNEMAIAWLLSEMLVKYYDKTVEYLKKSKLDKFTYNKGIQKARESFRITKEQKEFLKSMKK